MSEQDIKKELDEVLSIVKELKSRRRQDPAHQEEHEYLRQMIAEHKARKEFWSNALSNLATAGLWATLALIGTALWFSIKHWIIQ